MTGKLAERERRRADRVAWSSDFAHREAKYPDGVAQFLAGADLDEGDAQPVLWEPVPRDAPCQLYAP